MLRSGGDDSLSLRFYRKLLGIVPPEGRMREKTKALIKTFKNPPYFHPHPRPLLLVPANQQLNQNNSTSIAILSVIEPNPSRRVARLHMQAACIPFLRGSDLEPTEGCISLITDLFKRSRIYLLSHFLSSCSLSLEDLLVMLSMLGGELLSKATNNLTQDRTLLGRVVAYHARSCVGILTLVYQERRRRH